MSEEINEALLEGESANNWAPGAWVNATEHADEEYQPDIEAPRINDYAAFKKHKHYRKYFRTYRYEPFPAIVYHKTLEQKVIDVRFRDGKIDNEACKKMVMELGPEWSPIPNKPRVDMTGKSHPTKSETQRLAEVIAQAMPAKQGAIDATAIASIVAAVMAATGQKQPVAIPADEPVKVEAAPDMERMALIELAEKEGVKIDKRWSNPRIKEALGI